MRLLHPTLATRWLRCHVAEKKDGLRRILECSRSRSRFQVRSSVPVPVRSTSSASRLSFSDWSSDVDRTWRWVASAPAFRHSTTSAASSAGLTGTAAWSCRVLPPLSAALINNSGTRGLLKQTVNGKQQSVDSRHQTPVKALCDLVGRCCATLIRSRPPSCCLLSAVYRLLFNHHPDAFDFVPMSTRIITGELASSIVNQVRRRWISSAR